MNDQPFPKKDFKVLYSMPANGLFEVNQQNSRMSTNNSYQSLYPSPQKELLPKRKLSSYTRSP
jgi:hypothetical protein